MTAGQGFLWLIALVALGFCLRRGPATAQKAAGDTWQSLLKILPMFAVALPMAALLAELVPADAASRWIGGESGLSGIVIASFAGGLMPGGPFVTFPLVLAFAKAGAGVAQMGALITGWSIFAMHRIISWEYPLLGWRFVVIRMLSAAVLPILAGLLMQLLLPVFPVGLGKP